MLEHLQDADNPYCNRETPTEKISVYAPTVTTSVDDQSDALLLRTMCV
jgi:hypothetical protein